MIPGPAVALSRSFGIRDNYHVAVTFSLSWRRRPMIQRITLLAMLSASILSGCSKAQAPSPDGGMPAVADDDLYFPRFETVTVADVQAVLERLTGQKMTPEVLRSGEGFERLEFSQGNADLIVETVGGKLVAMQSQCALSSDDDMRVGLAFATAALSSADSGWAETGESRMAKLQALLGQRDEPCWGYYIEDGHVLMSWSPFVKKLTISVAASRL